MVAKRGVGVFVGVGVSVKVGVGIAVRSVVGWYNIDSSENAGSPMEGEVKSGACASAAVWKTVKKKHAEKTVRR